MAHLSISLLGSPQVSLDGVQLKIPASRAMPLIAYLAMSGKPQSRETLAGMLWPDSSQTHALAALRTTLWRLKNAGLESWIALERDDIYLDHLKNIDIDVVRFKTLLDKCTTHGHPVSHICLYCTPVLTEAVETYRGEFMAGFNISKALTFDDWRMQQSETLETVYLDALERLVRCHRTFGDFNLAIHYARIWLSIDRLNENAHYQLLQLYSITGQRTAAISLYRHYKDLLYRELGVEPTNEMTALYKQIASGHSTPVSRHKVNSPVFLIADIEKSAVYWTRAGEAKDHILATYTNIVKETAQRFGGHVLQKTEDNITVLFENGQPLHCAVTIHLKVKKALWGEVGPPSVRMVLYTTFMDIDTAGNFAMLTKAASSLLSISWGGQILFTDQTLKLLDIPSGSSIKDLGFHYLNETDGSIHVYELLHPHLPAAEHPPLQSSTQQLFNFPIYDPPFVDREQEMRELTEMALSAEDRIISLVGPGGVGKTRLAVQFASKAAEYFPEGIYFISFASIQNPDFIPILLADALNFSFYGPTSQTDQLGNYLHRMKALLIFDNFEHVKEQGAKLLATLLVRTQNLKIIVTSRERLNMIAESVLEVHGFPVPDAHSTEDLESYTSIKLFIHNAQKTFPRFANQSNMEAIVRICKIVDGNPLGILLASSWVRVFSCPEIASEIEKNLDFLTTSAPDIDPRHRSLSAVFDNSWNLLSEEERRILRRLSIFRTAFTTRAAQEICDATPLLLSVYTDKSLIVRHPDDHFEMLTTFRQYAFNKLEQVQDELAQTKDKFCSYYADFCAQKQIELNTSVQRQAILDMIAEIENIRIAWSWIVDSERWDLVYVMKQPLQAYHIILGNYTQGNEFFRLAWQKLNKLSSPDLDLNRAMMQQLSAWMTCRIGFTREGIQGLNKSLEIFRQHHSAWDTAQTLYYLAEAYQLSSDLQLGKQAIEEAIQIIQEADIPRSNFVTSIFAHCKSTLGAIYLGLGELESARHYLNESLSIHQQVGTKYGSVQTLVLLGRLAILQGEFLDAKDLYLQALETATNIYDQRGMALLHNNLGAVYEGMANTALSYHHILTAQKLCQDTGDRRLNAVILNNLAYHQLRYLHQSAESIRTYHECIEVFSDLGDLRGLIYTSYDISKAYLNVGLLDEAGEYCGRSLNTALTMDSLPLVLHALHGFINLFATTGQLERALRICYLIAHHPQIEPDTQKRVIVSQSILETSLPYDLIDSARLWAESTHLQDIINQLQVEKTHR